MIFHDKKKNRKWVFRSIITLSVLIFAIMLFDVASEITKSSPQNDFNQKTKNYYRYYQNTPDNKIALTFDDGPHPISTPRIIEILKKNNVPATFFFVGKNAIANKEIVREAHLKGFEIGNHSFSHQKYIYKKEKYLKWELNTTNKIIKDITDEPTILYRPPFLYGLGGDPTINPYVNKNLQLTWAAKHGFIPVGVDIDPKDYLKKTPEALLESLLKELPNGKIILLHDGEGKNIKNTINSLETIINHLKKEGYQFVKVSELLGLSNDLKNSPSSKNDPSLKTLTSTINSSNKQSASQLSEKYFKNHYSSIEKFYKTSYQHTIEKKVDPSLLLSIKFNQNKKPLSWFFHTTKLKLNKTLRFYHQKIQSYFIYFLSSVSNMMSILFKFILILIVFRILFFATLLIRKIFLNKFKRNITNKAFGGTVDVIIPAWNEQENIQATIESVLQNNYPLKKIIVIDDGSTDNTVKIVQKVQEKYPRKIKLISLKKNGGKSNALNIGFSVSNSEIIIALDADTIFDKNTIKNLVKHFGDETISTVAGKVKTVKSFNILNAFQSIEYIIGQNIEKQLFGTINSIGVIPGAVGAWRKSVVLQSGGYSNDTLVEDQDLTLTILKSKGRIIYEPKAISYTEAPQTLRAFAKQRLRWIYGTIQCFWKNKKHFFSNKKGSLGLIILPNILIYNTLLPLFSPLIDLVAILSLFFGSWQKIIAAYLLFTLLDLFYASTAFWNKKENGFLLLILPFQRIFYRQILSVIVIQSVIKAIEGSYAKWIRIQKIGFAQEQFIKKTKQKT